MEGPCSWGHKYVLREHSFRLRSRLYPFTRLQCNEIRDNSVGHALSYLLVQPLAGKWADTADAATTVQAAFWRAIGIIITPILKGMPLVAVTIVSGAGDIRGTRKRCFGDGPEAVN